MHMNMQLRSTLDSLNARAMVVGHTPQMSGVNCECDGRVWRVDAGMSSGVLDAAPQVLEFSHDNEGKLVARMLRQAMHGVEATTRTYPAAQPSSPERPSSPSPMDTGAPSYA
jgi:hypothetical protein